MANDSLVNVVLNRSIIENIFHRQKRIANFLTSFCFRYFITVTPTISSGFADSFSVSFKTPGLGESHVVYDMIVLKTKVII